MQASGIRFLSQYDNNQAAEVQSVLGKTGVDPVNDHAWDFGSVSADPTSPTRLAAMWTTC
jgi:hypothetical protein